MKLITIIGPTASGKTSFACRLAYLTGGEILSGDSGLYMESVLKGYRLLEVPENPALRESLKDKSLARNVASRYTG